MSNYDLKIKTDKVAIVINAQKESPNPLQELEQIQSILLTLYKTFIATIIHDKDKLVNGDLKTIHLHAYIELGQKYTLKAILDTLSNSLSIDKCNIQIEPTNNDYLIVQYLTHKNDKDKTNYPIENIKTNDSELLLDKWNKTYKSEDEIRREILHKCPTTDFIELVDIYGISQVNSLRGLIKDIKAESKDSTKVLEKKINCLYVELEDIKDFTNRLITNLYSYLTKREKNLLDLDKIRSTFEDIIAYHEIDNR